MDHAGAAHFKPAGVLADAAALAVADRAVDREIDARLDKGEEVAAEPDPPFGSEKLPRHLVQHAFEIGHRDVRRRPPGLRVDGTSTRARRPVLRSGSSDRARSRGPAARLAPSRAPASARCGCGGRSPRLSDSTIIVSQTSRAGWSLGMLSRSKLYQPVSTSRPKTVWKPINAKISLDLVDHLRDRMDDARRRLAGPGSVTSIASAANFCSSSRFDDRRFRCFVTRP